jgi:hypothetical protein
MENANKNEELSAAVVAFLGFGSSSSPQNDHSAIILQFGPQRAVFLDPQVVSLIAEIGAIPVDWSKYDLQMAGEMAKSKMRDLHPELTAEALSALEWKFTFDWR